MSLRPGRQVERRCVVAGSNRLGVRGQTTQDGSVVLSFSDEGTANKGNWHETLGLAASWRRPSLFLCENNLYGITTHITGVMAVEYVLERASAVLQRQLRAEDGPDAVPAAGLDKAHRAVDRVVVGQGQSLHAEPHRPRDTDCQTQSLLRCLSALCEGLHGGDLLFMGRSPGDR